MKTDGQTLQCADCGAAFWCSHAMAARHAARGWDPPRRCFRCREWRRQPRATRGPAPGSEARVCSECGRSFDVAFVVRARCEANHWPLPRACKVCRLRGDLETWLPALAVLGDPLGDDVAFALASGDDAVVRAAHGKVTQWRQTETHAQPTSPDGC